jgi:hypothetical protein
LKLAQILDGLLPSFRAAYIAGQVFGVIAFRNTNLLKLL